MPLKVAKALDVDVGRLFSNEDHRRPAALHGGQRCQALATALSGKSMSPFVVRPTGGEATDPRPEHAGQEFVFVQGLD
jgi:hypothetical protein